MTNLAAEATDLITAALAKHNPCTLSCDCGSNQVWLSPSNLFTADREQVEQLIEHARYAHAGRRAIIVTPPPSILVDYSEEQATR